MHVEKYQQGALLGRIMAFSSVRTKSRNLYTSQLALMEAGVVEATIKCAAARINKYTSRIWCTVQQSSVAQVMILFYLERHQSNDARTKVSRIWPLRSDK